MLNNDESIRPALRALLQRQHSGDLIVDEFVLCQGEARADIVVVNGALHGYEIKSEGDDLRRLPNQKHIYSSSLDYITIVTTAKHYESVSKAIPAIWGIVVAGEKDGIVEFTEARKPMRNFLVSPYALLALLWNSELAEIAKTIDGKSTGGKSKHKLGERIVSELPLPQLAELVRTKIKSRQGWRGQKPAI